MKPNFIDILDTCLAELEQGVSVDALVNRYPHFAEDLRPILETALDASSLAVKEVPADVLKRGKVRVLRAAAEQREKLPVALPFWLQIKQVFERNQYIPRLAFNLLLVAILLFTAGTSLVSASAESIPGDNLYPMKRGLESLRLWATLDEQAKVTIKNQLEEERLREVEHVLAQKRQADVEFIGVVTSQQETEWIVGGIRVSVSEQTQMDEAVQVGDIIQINGTSQADGVVLAREIRLVTSLEFSPLLLPPDGNSDILRGQNWGSGVGKSAESSSSSSSSREGFSSSASSSSDDKKEEDDEESSSSEEDESEESSSSDD